MGNKICGEVCGGGSSKQSIEEAPLIPSRSGGDEGADITDEGPGKRGQLDEEQLKNIILEAKSLMIPLSMSSSASSSLSPLSLILASAPRLSRQSSSSAVEVGEDNVDGGTDVQALEEDKEERKFGGEPLIERL
mmetsp:Transcript_5491/g.11003  ORF Transcript_5491/g.11003 Transcript_5491/m.11003 type:complete len:134 (-) Transcript_5491:21-422(-)